MNTKIELFYYKINYMCGRFSRFTGQDIIINRFGVDESRAQIGKSYNIAPTDSVPVITRENPVVMDLMRWGFIPFYAKSPSDTHNPINARDDSLQNNIYKYSIESKRCLIPVNGFFEWKKILGIKQPYFIKLASDEIFALGGIYSKYKPKNSDESEIYSFAIITTSPNDQISDIHDRMPLILNKNDERTWIDPEVKMFKEISPLIRPYDGELEIYPVSKYVNSPKNNTSECINPISEDKIGVDIEQTNLDDFF